MSSSVFLWEKVCKPGLALPEAYEKAAYGTPAVYVEKKLFARLKEDGETIAVYTDHRDEWIASNPDTFYFTDHYKDYPMMLVDLNTVSRQDLDKILLESWKIRASKRLLKLYKC